MYTKEKQPDPLN
jgi:hypothetical protein